jgi:hypothetical protein
VRLHEGCGQEGVCAHGQICQIKQQHPETISFYVRGAGEEEVFLARDAESESDSARNRKGGIKYRKSSNTTVGLFNYCLAMVSMMVAAVEFSDNSKRPRVKGTINGAAVQFLVDSGHQSQWCRRGHLTVYGEQQS